jgi:lipopolysaccharide transport system permease protein
MTNQPEQKWEWQISPESSWLGAGYKELWQYRDLLFGLVRKDFLSSYQQTLLGPLWVLVNPLLSVLIYLLLLNRIIGIKTDGIPPFLFYLSGITLWNLFADVYTGTASIISSNAGIFNKVYFPRFIVPLSTVLLTLFRFGIQLLFLLLVCLYYYNTSQIAFSGYQFFYIFPAILLVICTALGLGLISSVITAKYRDLTSLLQLCLRLGMFVTPVLFAASKIPDKFSKWMLLNPLSVAFEWFRMALFGYGSFSFSFAAVNIFTSLIILFAGIGLYNKFTVKLLDVA